MIALLKAHWIIALAAAVGAWILLRRQTSAMLTTAPAQKVTGQPVTDPAVLAQTKAAASDWPGGMGDPGKVVWADQYLYPGFLRNQYGAYYNPDTHEDYSPGSSPPVMLNAYQTGAMTMAYIDTTAAAPPQAQKDTQAGGKDYNAVTANAVIY